MGALVHMTSYLFYLLGIFILYVSLQADLLHNSGKKWLYFLNNIFMLLQFIFYYYLVLNNMSN